MSQLSCPDYTVLAVIPQLFCQNFPVLGHGCHVLAVIFRPSCPLCLVRADITRLPWVAGLSILTCPSCPFPTVTPSAQLSFHGCPVKVILSCLSCLVPAVISRHFLAGLALFYDGVLPLLPSPTLLSSCPVLAVLPRLLSWLGLSLRGCTAKSDVRN